MKKLSLKVAATLLVMMPTLGFSGSHVLIRVKPPLARVEVRTKAPSTRHVWVSGRWAWKNNRYVWVSGTWVKRPTTRAIWVSGHWKKEHGAWIWISGHWKY